MKQVTIMSTKIHRILAAGMLTAMSALTINAITPAKDVKTHLTFDQTAVDFDRVDRQQAKVNIWRAADTISFCKGVKGHALDMTDDVANRIPVRLTPAETPDYTKPYSFSVWVQTKPGARQGTPILSNKKYIDPRLEQHRERRNWRDDIDFKDETKTPGITVGTTDLGGWYLHLCDGNTWYNYSPTAERQRINDGKWHNIAASIDLDNKEMWVYFDGKNVAVYNMPELESTVGELPTMIGGSDEYTEAGHNYSRGERLAFNGRIDEVKIWDRPVSADEIAAEYATYFPASTTEEELPIDKLRVQAWNIWHGGGRFGEHVGVARTAEVLKTTNADLIGLIEAYGSGAILADSLGYYYYLLSDNLAILSRYPIESTIKCYKPQRSGGVIVDLPANKKVAFFDIWLDWHWETDTIRSNDIKAIAPTLAIYGANADEIPVISVGDYNSGTHLDSFGYKVYGEKRIDNPAISWPSKVMVEDLGFTDSFRYMYPNSDLYPGSTWTPLYNGRRNITPNRVDFIYYKGKDLKPYYSETAAHHGVAWPSDHATVITDFFIR